MSRIVVISGGGTGIGLAVAEAFVRDGDQVVLVGRRGTSWTRRSPAWVPDPPWRSRRT